MSASSDRRRAELRARQGLPPPPSPEEVVRIGVLREAYRVAWETSRESAAAYWSFRRTYAAGVPPEARAEFHALRVRLREDNAQELAAWRRMLRVRYPRQDQP